MIAVLRGKSQRRFPPLSLEIRDRIDEAWRWLESGDVVAASDEALELVEVTDRHPDALQLLGAALIESGQIEEGLKCLEEAEEGVSDRALTFCYEGIAHLERCRFGKAHRSFVRALALDPTFAYGHFGLARCHEYEGRKAQAEGHYAEAHRLDPQACPLPVRMRRRAFETVVQEAIELLPKELRDVANGIPVVVRDLPSLELLTVETPPLPPDILGLFVGSESPQKGEFDLVGTPEVIFLFQRNLELFCATREELIEEISTTIYHEIAHQLGLDEEDLLERGAD